MKKFEGGDIVQLKSGGPDMTVESHHEHDKVYCTWFTAFHEHRRDYFGPNLIERSSDENDS
jgi:uncharacterized protein YodC (DUF2158 family)